MAAADAELDAKVAVHGAGSPPPLWFRAYCRGLNNYQDFGLINISTLSDTSSKPQNVIGNE